MVKGNTTGGKKYKKSKHGGAAKKPYIEPEKDQMVARVLRNFGNRNLQCYCNDAKVRLCHIRGAMRNRVWINVGDLVLISCRALSKDSDTEKADILAKYDQEHVHKLKQEPGINENLFRAMETADSRIDDIFDRTKEDEEGGVEFDKYSDEEGDSDTNAANTIVKKKKVEPTPVVKPEEDDDADVNIDNI